MLLIAAIAQVPRPTKNKVENDEIDDELINILKKRMTVIEQIGEYKKEQHITIFQLERWQEILRSRIQWVLFL